MSATVQEQLTKYLTDAHSIEEQALQQMRMAPRIAGDAQMAEHFRAHLTETEEHERRTRELLDARGAGPSKVKDAVMKAGGVGFALFARAQPDTPGKLVAHAFSYEHLERASYELLERVAQRAGDERVAAVARAIRDEEIRMAQLLAADFDRAAEASLREKGAEDLAAHLRRYLTDAHALEAQAAQLLEKGSGMVGDPELARIMSEHLDETREHERLVRERLEALGAQPSKLKDAAMTSGALNWGMFFGAHPDTPGKLTAFAYAFEHLEIAAYELLKRVAHRAGDEASVAMADRILVQERAAAEKLEAAFDRAVDASLEALGVGA